MLKKLIYNLKRGIYVREITHKIGKCIFSEDIVCYVKAKVLQRYKKSDNKGTFYEIDLTEDKEYGDVKKQFDLDKRVCYIFDGINFDFGVKLNIESDAKVEFQNCTFNGPIEINGDNLEVVFRFCKYSYENPNYIEEQPFFKCCARRLEFEGESFSNSSPRLKYFQNHTNFGINIDVDSLRIATKIQIVDTKSKINIKATRVQIEQPIICPTITINCEKLHNYDTSIEAENRVTINCGDNKPLMDITAPEVFYNGQIVKPNGEGEISLHDELIVVTSEDLKADLIALKEGLTSTYLENELDKRIGLNLE